MHACGITFPIAIAGTYHRSGSWNGLPCYTNGTYWLFAVAGSLYYVIASAKTSGWTTPSFSNLQSAQILGNYIPYPGSSSPPWAGSAVVQTAPC
jgi:hypothetical protein